jgi:hypothetical protein
LRAAAAIEAGQSIDIEFADGHVRAVADGTPPARTGEAPRPRRKGGGASGQGSLFGA